MPEIVVIIMLSIEILFLFFCTAFLCWIKINNPERKFNKWEKPGKRYDFRGIHNECPHCHTMFDATDREVLCTIGPRYSKTAYRELRWNCVSCWQHKPNRRNEWVRKFQQW